MNWCSVLIGCALLLVAGFVGADSISSTIVCDGATWVSSSVIGQGQTYAANLFTTNLALMARDLKINSDGSVNAGTVAESSGPMGIDEYSEQVTNETQMRAECVFEEKPNQSRSKDEIMYIGLMGSGVYSSARVIKPGTTGATTMVNGTGMILARASSRNNLNETTHSSDVAGSMNMTERIIFGEDE